MQLYQPTITGSLSVSGSINTTGTITATTLVVQTVTSSVSYLTGSTQFGSLSSNTHQFTGSILVTGSVAVGITNPSYSLDIAAGSNGNVFTPAARISTSTGGAGGGTILQINHTANSVSGLQILQAGASAGNYTSINNTENSYMFFSTNNTERMRISASGSVSIGTTSTTGQALNTANAGVTNTNTYLGTGQLRIGGGSDHGSSTVLSVAPGVVTFDRPGVGGGALTINSSGYVTFPSQPSFYATSTAGSSTYSSSEVIVFNTARHNIGSCYNTSNGRFTAPVAGRYLFTLNVYNYTGYTNGIVLTINGSQYAPADVQPLLFTGNVGSISTGFTLVWELAANDYVEVRVRSGASANIYRAHSHFSGCLLG